MITIIILATTSFVVVCGAIYLQACMEEKETYVRNEYRERKLLKRAS